MFTFVSFFIPLVYRRIRILSLSCQALQNISGFIGQDTEIAYARAFNGKVIGGFEDHGLDVLTGDPNCPFVQVKSSITGLKDFLANSLRHHKFIPVCVGEPGNRLEMLQHLREHGAWIGTDIPGRTQLELAVEKVRSLLSA